MMLYVVVDLMGAGRLVGVFDDEAYALRVVGEFPQYYKVLPCRAQDDARLDGHLFVSWNRAGGTEVCGSITGVSGPAWYDPDAWSGIFLNRIDPDVLGWTKNDAQRAHLETLLAEEKDRPTTS
jgi:hypothetical protein